MKKLIIIIVLVGAIITTNVYAFNTSESFNLPRFYRLYSNNQVEIYADTYQLIQAAKTRIERKQKGAFEIPFNADLIYLYKTNEILTSLRKNISDSVNDGVTLMNPSMLTKINGLIERATFDFVDNKVLFYSEISINADGVDLIYVTKANINESHSFDSDEFPEIKKNILLFFDKVAQKN